MAELTKMEHKRSFSAFFECSTPVDEAVEATGHTPNGYFWEDVAKLLIAAHTPGIAKAVQFDCEGSMFSAESKDESVLDVVIGLMTPVINDSARVTSIIAEALAAGYEFDD